MSRYRRAWVPGGTYFFTVNTESRQAVLTREPFLAALRAAFERVRAERPFQIHAIVILPDHLHCVLELPEGDLDYATRWAGIKRMTSQSVRNELPNPRDSKSRRRELGLWQRRYWEHQIRDEQDFERHVDYVHRNPVKHGHASAVAEWPHSSFHRYVRQGLLPQDWGGQDDQGVFGER